MGAKPINELLGCVCVFVFSLVCVCVHKDHHDDGFWIFTENSAKRIENINHEPCKKKNIISSLFFHATTTSSPIHKKKKKKKKREKRKYKMNHKNKRFNSIHSFIM
jgi:hypothetical protein